MIDSRYGIPNDSKKLRRHVFMELMTPDADTGYMDGEDYHLLVPYVEDKKLSMEQLFWMAFLYGTSYSCTTTIRFMEEFPTIKDVTPKAIRRFWDKNRETLHYAPDKRYLKNNNQVIPAIQSIYKLSQKDMCSYITPLLKGGFENTYKEIVKNWKYFGPSGAYLFFDCIYGYVPSLYSDPDAFDWKNMGKTVVEGMAHLLCDDEAIETRQFDYRRYDNMVDIVLRKTNSVKIVIESNLCYFRKLFKGTRYLGYYADRQLEECHKTGDILKNRYGIDIWNYRERTCPPHLRGELNGWDGIRKERYKIFLKTGTLMGESDE